MIEQEDTKHTWFEQLDRVWRDPSAPDLRRRLAKTLLRLAAGRGGKDNPLTSFHLGLHFGVATRDGVELEGMGLRAGLVGSQQLLERQRHDQLVRSPGGHDGQQQPLALQRSDSTSSAIAGSAAVAEGRSAASAASEGGDGTAAMGAKRRQRGSGKLGVALGDWLGGEARAVVRARSPFRAHARPAE